VAACCKGVVSSGVGSKEEPSVDCEAGEPRVLGIDVMCGEKECGKKVGVVCAKGENGAKKLLSEPLVKWCKRLRWTILREVSVSRQQSRKVGVAGVVSAREITPDNVCGWRGTWGP